MSKITRVGITSFGSNTAIGVAKVLKNSTSEIEIIGIDSNSIDETTGNKFSDYFHQVPLASREIDFVNALNKIIDSRNISILIPIHDIELEVLSRKKDKINCKIAVNSNQVIKKCGDKLIANKVASKFTKVPDYGINKVPKDSKIIIKSVDGVGSRDITIVEKSMGLNIRKGFFWQDFISGPEYTVDCYRSYNSNNYFAYPRVRKETKGGIATKSDGLNSPELINIARNILEYLDYRGVANLQFIENNGEYYFIEINPRFAGSGILSYSNGLRAPCWTISELLNLGVDFSKVKLDYNKKMIRYFEEVFYEGNS